MKLYEFAVVHIPKTTTRTQEGVYLPEPSIIVQPTCVLAKDEKHASMIATRAIPQSHADKLDEVDVAVRPF